MGKSEVVPMPLHRQANVFTSCNSFHLVAEDVEEDEGIPRGMQVFGNQVAGHTNNGKSYGLIKNKGTILKPIWKKSGEREIEFYQEVNIANDKTRTELREFIPKFHGSMKVPINGNEIDCLVLEDLTKDFKEPCVMDIKIGRRTWDPFATYNKIVNEEGKYHDCKRDLSFCIPGFQVYQLTNNTLMKFDKTYGKNLGKDSVPKALKTFLNAETTFCRSLIVQFLAALWRIQMWARKQRYYHFYSSSLLLVYDARRLREHVKTDTRPVTLKLQRSTSLYRPLSLAVLNKSEDKIQTGFSGQLTPDGPILRTPTSNKFFDFGINSISNNSNNVWQKSMRALKRTHSFQNDYDKDIQNRRQDYTYMLDELCMEQKSELWASVKMIDFAHAFPAERCRIDQNYLDGVDNLVRIFEQFLVDCE